ncbi:MAG TPA: winged helix-turn-helix domain-containing protein, partial [Thermoanaerobaculia bacterium]|nr:winged helix-turn-helix domain-containing protein [Thermoanaerobaculia bacterium]
YRFGPFTLDTDREELKRSGLDLRLHGQPMQILRLLVDKAGEVVTREEIQTAIWGNETHVGFEQGINTAIRQIRAILGDNAEAPRYIRTVPRRGYVFIAPVERDAPDGARASRPQAPRVPRDADAPFPLAPDPRPRRRGRRSAAAAMVAAAMALILAASSFLAVLVARRHRLPAARTIAVSPFRPIGIKSTGVDERAFEEELRAAIALLPERHVRLITEPDARADILIEGTVQRTPDGVRVIASGIDADSDLQLWSETYERPSEWTDGIAIETAHRVALEVARRYLPAPRREPLLVTRANAKALDAYRRARAERDPDPGASQRFFEQALAAEPRFPEALSGLADICAQRMLGGPADIRKRAATRAADYARRAIELQPCNAEAWSARGIVALQYDFDLAAAEDAFRRAIACDPEYGVAHFNLAATYASRGKFDDALREYAIARQLDPATFAVHPMEARIHLYARQYDAALARYRESLSVTRESPPLLFGQIATYAAQHRWRDAVAAAHLLADRLEIPTRKVPPTEAGFRQVYRHLEPFIREACRNGTFNDYVAAAYYAELGDREQALEWLELSVDNHAPSLSYALVDPRMDSLRADPRFQQLLGRTKLSVPRNLVQVTQLQRPPSK